MEPKSQDPVHPEKTISEAKQDSIHEENVSVQDQNAVIQDWIEKEERALVSVVMPSEWRIHILTLVGGRLISEFFQCSALYSPFPFSIGPISQQLTSLDWRRIWH